MGEDRVEGAEGYTFYNGRFAYGDNSRECYSRRYTRTTGTRHGGGRRSFLGTIRPIVSVTDRRCLAFSGTTVLVKYSHRCICGLMGRKGLPTSQVDDQVTFIHGTSVRVVLTNGPCREMLPACGPVASSSLSLGGEHSSDGPTEGRSSVRYVRPLRCVSKSSIVTVCGIGHS